MSKIHLFMNQKALSGKTIFSRWYAEFLEQSGGEITRFFLTKEAYARPSLYNPKNGIHIDMSGYISELGFKDSLQFGSFRQLIKRYRYTDIVMDTDQVMYLEILYLLANKEFQELLIETGQELIIHIPVAAYDRRDNCLQSLETVLVNFEHLDVVVWFNNLNGNVNTSEWNFKDKDIYKNYRDRYLQMLEIPRIDYEGDFQIFLKGATFKEVEQNQFDGSNILVRSRLLKYRDAIYEEISKI